MNFSYKQNLAWKTKAGAGKLTQWLRLPIILEVNPDFSFYHPHGGSQTPDSPVPEYLVLFSDLRRHLQALSAFTCTWVHRYLH